MRFAHRQSRAWLQVGRRELAFAAPLAKLGKYHLLILDDLACVTKE